MKILTLNTWQERGPWRERWEVTFEGLSRFRPDLVSFQELFNPEWAREVQRRAGYAQMHFSREVSGLVIYTRYPVLSTGILQLTPSSLEEYGRYALWAELEAQGGRLFVFNTHLSWQREDGPTRERQAEDLLDLAGKKAGHGEILLMGDLNASPDSPEIKFLTAQDRFHDLFSEKHPEDKGLTWDNRNPYAASSEHKMPDRRIDYILARGEGPLLKDLISCDIVLNQPSAQGVWASDHYGILAEFK